MKRLVGLLVLVFLMHSCRDKSPDIVTQEKPDPVIETASNYKLDIYDYNGFEGFLSKKDEKTYVINFWATWCAPCIKELPYFEQVNAKYIDRNVEVILVSLDFPKQYDKKLIPFIKARKLQSKVIALDDPKMNDWIPKVDEDWSGAIPATIIYNKDKSQFYERSFNLEELESELQKFITS